MKRYAEVLRVPHVAALIASTLLARFPIGINALALILYLREQTGSYAVAGVVAGGLAAGAGVGAPVQGRLVDRLGQRRVLVPLAFIHAAALGGVVALTELGAPTVVLLACSTAAGFAIPPTSSVLRSMWPSLLRERQDLIPAAYALDSVLIELIFVLGPLLTAVIATLMSPAAALIVSAASVMIGTIAFTAQAPSRAILPDPEATAAAGRFGALSSPGVRSLVLTSLPAGIGIGICEVTLPAFSEASSGSRELAGLLLAMWSLGSAAGGLAFGAWTRRPPLQRVHLAVTALLPLALLPLAAASSIPVMALLVLPAGMFIAPLLATRNELIGWVAPPGAAHRGLHLARHRLRRRHRDRLRHGRSHRRVVELAGRVPRRRRRRGRRRGGGARAARDAGPAGRGACLRRRQREPEGVVPAVGGLDAHAATVPHDDLAADGQAEAGPARAALVAAAPVRLEDALAILGRDRPSLALDQKAPAVGVPTRDDADLRPLARPELERVREQVRKDRGDQRRVGLDPGQFAHLDLRAARADLGREQRQRLAHHDVDVDGAPLQRAPAGAGVLQERLHELPRAGGGPPQSVEIAARLGVELVVEPLQRRRRVGVDHDERGEELVRGLGREPVEGGLLALELRDPQEQPRPLRLRNPRRPGESPCALC